jgi:hypothetical protein
MTTDIEATLQSCIGKEVKYKGINYKIEEIKNTYSGVKMIFLKDKDDCYFEPSFNLFVDEILKIKQHR